jgi:hypothetical protein
MCRKRHVILLPTLRTYTRELPFATCLRSAVLSYSGTREDDTSYTSRQSACALLCALQSSGVLKLRKFPL